MTSAHNFGPPCGEMAVEEAEGTEISHSLPGRQVLQMQGKYGNSVAEGAREGEWGVGV